ncbi:MAG: AAA family ATPase [bacterium]
MTRITRLHVRNFRSIEALTLDLDKKATLLVGPNGAGKSNVIDALSFIADAVSLGLDAAIGHRDGIDAIRRRPPSHGTRGRPVDVRLEVEMYSSDRTPMKLPNGRMIIKPAKREKWGYGFTLGARAGGAWYVKEEWIACAGRLILHVHEGTIKAEGTHKAGGFDLTLDDQRLMAPLLGRASTGPILGGLASFRRFDISPDLLRAPQSFSQARSLESNGTNLNHVWSILEAEQSDLTRRLTELLSQVTPRLSAVRSQTVGRYKTLEADFRLDDGRTVLVDGAGLSDGTLRALALLVAVHHPVPLSLIAIEEPEKALHPHAAELLFDALLSAGSSPPLLISTHSPSILTSRAFELSMLRVVEWRDGRTVVGPVADDLVADVTARLTTAPELLIEGSLTLDDKATHSNRSLRPSR